MELPDPALWNVFADGARVVTTAGSLGARTLELGELTLPTGRMVASDPLLDPWNEPYSVQISPGSYPVFLAMAGNDVALVMVSFGDEPPVSWKAAEPPAFNVDSATGCLMDHKVCRDLRRKAEAGNFDRYLDRFRRALDQEDGLSASVGISGESGANVVLFRTGGGDGSFRSYFGHAADGSPTCLVIDMFLEFEYVLAVEPAVDA